MLFTAWDLTLLFILYRFQAEAPAQHKLIYTQESPQSPSKDFYICDFLL